MQASQSGMASLRENEPLIWQLHRQQTKHDGCQWESRAFTKSPLATGFLHVGHLGANMAKCVLQYGLPAFSWKAFPDRLSLHTAQRKHAGCHSLCSAFKNFPSTIRLRQPEHQSVAGATTGRPDAGARDAVNVT